jgi:hypothetical protein
VSAAIEMKGEEVVTYLRGHSSVRDGMLASLIIHSVDQEPVVDLIFEMIHEAPVRIVHLHLRGVREFAMNHDDRHLFYNVAMIKCLWLPTAEFYLSLDPYDESEEAPSDRDNDFFRSASVEMTVRHQQ